MTAPRRPIFIGEAAVAGLLRYRSAARLRALLPTLEAQGFPPPVPHKGTAQLWRRDQVEDWLHRRRSAAAQGCKLAAAALAADRGVLGRIVAGAHRAAAE